MPITEFVIPEGYERVDWSQLATGDTVFICGIMYDKPHAYGPHKIHNAANRELASGTPQCKGRTFKYYPNDLIIRSPISIDSIIAEIRIRMSACRIPEGEPVLHTFDKCAKWALADHGYAGTEVAIPSLRFKEELPNEEPPNELA